MMKRKTRVALAAVMVVSAAGLAACNRPGATDEGSSGVIRLAAGVDPSYTPVYVAVDQGFFEDEGLEVDYFTTEGGPTMTQAVIAGEADVAVQSDTTTVTLMPTAPELRALAKFERSSSYIKVVHGPGVDSAEDIEKLVVVPGVVRLAGVRYLEHEGIDVDKVELIDATPPDIPSILKRGDADAAVIYEPWASRTADDAKGEIVSTIGDFGMTYSQLVVTTDGWLKDNEEDAAKFMSAMAKANEFIVDNPEEAAAITEEMIQTPADQVLEIMKELEFEVSDLDQADVDSGTAAAEFFVEAGSMKEVPDLEKQYLLGWYSENVG